jgi:hypothetical protein
VTALTLRDSLPTVQLAADRWRRPALLALSVIGALAVPYLAVRNWERSLLGFDAHAYWNVDLGNLYGHSFGNTSGLDAFRYTPPIGQVASVLHVIPWELFLAAWLSLLIGVLIWLTGRTNWLAAIAFPPVALELYHGNIHLLIAAAIVVGFRYPVAWAFIILTKVSPGIGVLWFVARQEWRKAAIALGVAGAIALASFVLAPTLWRQYLDAMLDNFAFVPPDGYPFPWPQWLRMPIAAALVVWAARTDRPWIVPIAAVLALPLIWWHGLSILVAIPALLSDRLAAWRPAPLAPATNGPGSRPALSAAETP